MKVLFVVTGFGFGDSVRTECIIEELRSKKSKVMILGYDFSYEHFKRRFKTLKMHGYRFPDYDLEFKTVRFLMKNLHLPLKWFLTSTENMNEIKKFNPDIVVSDFEPVSNLIAKKIRKKCVTIFGYDPEEFRRLRNTNKRMRLQARYIERIYRSSDYVLIPSYKKKRNFGNIKYVNPIVRKFRIKNKKTVMKKLGLKKEPFIVMLGGSNYGIELAKRIKELSKEFDEKFIFFGGKNKISKEHFSGFNENYLEYLSVCKGLITLAGCLTINEGLAFKKPMLVFPIKNHVEQLINASSIRRYAYVAEDKNVNKHLISFMKNLNRYENIVKMAYMKFNGAEQVVKFLKEVI